MSYLLSFLAVIISMIISIFLLSNILLSIFYTIPRISKEKRKNNLVKKIPIGKIVWVPLILLLILCSGVYLIYKYLPNYFIEILIGVGIGILMHVARIGKQNSDMEDDFRRYFKNYLKNDGFENPVDVVEAGYYLNPNDLKTLSKRAFEKYTINDYQSAIAIYDKILDLNPLLLDDLVMRAQCLERLNYNLDAIDDYESAISINDSDGNWFGLLGLVYQKIGNLEKAEEFLKLSVEKGWKMYESNLKMLSLLTHSDIRQALIEKCNKPENLTRRNKKDFEDDLSEIDRNEYNSNLIKSIEGVNRGLVLDPENGDLKRLHNYFYSRLN
jgi:tetratricopeptide (TPR) repeat protein